MGYRAAAVLLVFAAVALHSSPASAAGTLTTGGTGLKIQSPTAVFAIDLHITLTASGGSVRYLVRYKSGPPGFNEYPDLGAGCSSISSSGGFRGVLCNRTPGTTVDVDTGGGTDTVLFTPLPGDPVTSTRLGDPATVTTRGLSDSVGAGDNDVVAALGDGNDTFEASGGTGSGDVSGGDGNDTLNGGADSDTLNGGDGDDSIRGRSGKSDVVDGDAGDDTLRGDDGADTLRGDAGNDTLDGGAGTGVLQGGDGNDSINGGPGDDTIQGGAGGDQIRPFAGHDNVSAGDGDDTMFDVSSVSDGPDIYDGGLGFDRVSYQARFAPLTILIDTNANDGEAGEDDNLIGVDDVVLGAAADLYLSFVDDGPDKVSGGAGDDKLRTGAGPDDLTGGPGKDELTAASGNDTLNSQDGVVDTISCGTGDDVLFRDTMADASPADCETVSDSPRNEPFAAMIERRARRSRGRLLLRLSCPKGNRKPCAGQLVIRRGRRVIGRAAYRVAPRKRGTVEVPLSGAARGQLTATATEPGRRAKHTTRTKLLLR